MLHGPDLAVIPDVALPAGTTMHVALDGFDDEGESITYSAAVSGSNSVKASVVSGDRSLRMNVAGFGLMDFYLFEDDAPRVTSRIVELAQQNFYNNLIFHRIIEDFVIQGGDPQGTGSGGSGFDFDDQYSTELRHTTSGLLSMAKTTDDTNDSQFFITDAPTRHLDFNHSIFGFLTAGDTVRKNINAVQTDPQTNRPLSNVTLSSMTVFVDQENGVLRLSAPEGATGTATVTVTARDAAGDTTERSFLVTVGSDPRPASPYIPYAYLNPIPELVTQATTPLTFQLSARVVENLPVRFGFVADPTRATIQLSNTGDVTPDANGIAQVTVTLTPLAAATGTNSSITFYVHDPNRPAPSSPRFDGNFNSVADLQTEVLTVIEGTPVADTVGLYLNTTNDIFLRDSLTSGPADSSFKLTPASGSIALSGDWDGDGTDTPGFYDPATGKWFLRNANAAGTADLDFQYGVGGAGWEPVVGDWNGDGRDTVGLFHRAFSTFFLRNSNTAGEAEQIFHYGPPGQDWMPIAGDWDGDGVDTVGLYKPAVSEFFLRNRDAVGIADVRYVFGSAGQGLLPMTGDWDGDGIDTVALFNSTTNTFFIRNANTGGVADATFAFGPPGLGFKPLAGDWGGVSGAASSTATSAPDFPSDDSAADALAAMLAESDSASADEVDELFGSDEQLDELLS
ncbi:MAG: peptidylprolyl isomerase [Planctomycetes bacterium]|nr:peptidylprolyl isomerase [Planctomycetota bacterium]